MQRTASQNYSKLQWFPSPNHSLCLSMQEPLMQFLISKLFPPCKNMSSLQPKFEDAQVRWFLSSLPYKTLSSILNLERFSLAKSTKSSGSKQQLPLLILLYLTGNTSTSYTLLPHTIFTLVGGEILCSHWQWNKIISISFLKCYTDFSFITRNWKQSCIASILKKNLLDRAKISF